MPSSRAKTTRSPEGSRWLLIAGYVAIALMIGYGVVRARASRPGAERPKPFGERYSAVFAGPPAPDPLIPSLGARRVVRWCEVLGVLEAKCQRCHTTPRQHDAPFSLLSYADTQREYPPGSGLLVFQRLRDMVRHRRMPPLERVLDPPVEPLDEHQKDVLLVWAEEGGLAFGGEACGAGKAAEALGNRR